MRGYIYIYMHIYIYISNVAVQTSVMLHPGKFRVHRPGRKILNLKPFLASGLGKSAGKVIFLPSVS